MGETLEDRFCRVDGVVAQEGNRYGRKGQCMTENRWRRKKRETQTEVTDYQAEGGSSRDCQ